MENDNNDPSTSYKQMTPRGREAAPDCSDRGLDEGLYS